MLEGVSTWWNSLDTDTKAKIIAATGITLTVAFIAAHVVFLVEGVYATKFNEGRIMGMSEAEAFTCYGVSTVLTFGSEIYFLRKLDAETKNATIEKLKKICEIVKDTFSSATNHIGDSQL